VAASLVTAYNLYNTVATAEGASTVAVVGAWAMIIVALLITVAALVIAYDGWQAWARYRGAPVTPQPVGGGGGK
jgi:hypothetical protein